MIATSISDFRSQRLEEDLKFKIWNRWSKYRIRLTDLLSNCRAKILRSCSFWNHFRWRQRQSERWYSPIVHRT